ncbi:class I SAM-dependent methyltransferase [Montanilutibacter psychrotolerans]|uniref:Class I SAM-dependent methyltransferase n=1 Tax=Montanilutibacter psychrotolerans TaxID=1327343 RepID=A0A3M8T0N5_9GAMM|nr:class I SAM-dependent methyltransferase [Lysobacter psychrotolerans]RNF84262.1 class I SAM-dependent methyltransferase [Lysobacter psychrotolerans]
MKCRFCATTLGGDIAGADDRRHVFLDLGTAPPSNAFLAPEALTAPESWFPLRLYTCPNCLLVQVDEVQSHAQLFSPDYVYFSSYSRSWLEHAERYVERATERLGLGADSLVVEIASNDGYLLQYVAARGIPCVGIEPTAGTAEAARARGIDTIVEFFGREFAGRFVSQRGRADLVVANNVLAHVPDLNDFVAGIAVALTPQGVLTVEFPHLQQLVAQHQFDTVYHEHFSYFSLHTVCKVFAAHGLRVWDVEVLPTHGGSLRVWASPEASAHRQTDAVARVLAGEAAAGMLEADYYQGFQARADEVKDGLLEFLLQQRRAGRKVAGYGAAAKGNTLLNYAGVRRDLLPYVVDASPHKQGRFLPGSRIPVVAEQHLRDDRPDVVLILPWNLREEITAQLAYIREWGGRFATAVPAMEID